ncbi:hypothetical protein PR003_g11703 [Phytophthora rubi]|uniref:RxLR effector protein n=1 Tax=Phytophthora rubi TaxID=129364 RepID=A0A6A4F2D2_9STRA|nr:hypothetical protein PR002_g11253 [Phytophthora rubi]KAE9030902.1 hypothetical protein PR001_g11141 [Phytophthora rubi]KAE9338066.1 hypothetical protein PR003_g11703 [Phytophthora rubi]
MSKLLLLSALAVCALQLVSADPIAKEFGTPPIQRSLRAEVDSSSNGSDAVFEKKKYCNFLGIAYTCYSWFSW